MENIKLIKEELARKIQQCLSDAGVKAQIDLSEHEVVIHGKIETAEQTLKVIGFITDRDVRPADHGPVSQEIARARLATAVIRPTLAVQTATGAASEQIGTVRPVEGRQQHGQIDQEESE